MTNLEKKEIIICDRIHSTDSFNKKKKLRKKPSNRVIIREIKTSGNIITLEDTTNLVLYRGRNWLLQRAFNKSMTNRSDSETDSNWSDKYISWFGVGTGGCEAGNPMSPIDPINEEIGLLAHGNIGGTRSVTVNGKDYHLFDENYPKFLYDTDITETLNSSCSETDPGTGESKPCDGFMVAIIEITLNGDESNTGIGTNYQDINEAGLFISPSNSRAYSFNTNDMTIYSRVTFSTIRKTEGRKLLFTWFVYF